VSHHCTLRFHIEISWHFVRHTDESRGVGGASPLFYAWWRGESNGLHHQPASRRRLARRHRKPDLCRRHPRPPRPQRSSPQPVRRKPSTHTLKTGPERLTKPVLRCHQLPASEVPRPGRHHVGIPALIGHIERDSGLPWRWRQHRGKARGIGGAGRHLEHGTIEAISISAASGLALGVQWHAEYDPQRNPINQALFQSFGRALGTRRHAARQRRHSAQAVSWRG
jgi:hypothetical protein